MHIFVSNKKCTSVNKHGHFYTFSKMTFVGHGEKIRLISYLLLNQGGLHLHVIKMDLIRYTISLRALED